MGLLACSSSNCCSIIVVLVEFMLALLSMDLYIQVHATTIVIIITLAVASSLFLRVVFVFVFLLCRGLPHPVLPLPTDVWSSSLLPRVRRRAVFRKGPLACLECRSALLRYALLLLLLLLLLIAFIQRYSPLSSRFTALTVSD